MRRGSCRGGDARPFFLRGVPLAITIAYGSTLAAVHTEPPAPSKLAMDAFQTAAECARRIWPDLDPRGALLSFYEAGKQRGFTFMPSSFPDTGVREMSAAERRALKGFTEASIATVHPVYEKAWYVVQSDPRMIRRQRRLDLQRDLRIQFPGRSDGDLESLQSTQLTEAWLATGVQAESQAALALRLIFEAQFRTLLEAPSSGGPFTPVWVKTLNEIRGKVQDALMASIVSKNEENRRQALETARQWYERYQREYPEVARYRPFDPNGLGLYVEGVSSAISLDGCAAEPRVVAQVADIGLGAYSVTMYLVPGLDHRLFQAYAMLSLFRWEIPGWREEVALGTPPLQLLFRGLTR